jgi:hypothetical protein
VTEHFQNPPLKYRLLQFLLGYEEWFGEDEITIRENLLRVRDLGIGGLVVSVNQKQYLRSEKAWDVLRLGVRISKELGLRLWIYDEEGYPSGAAGGLVPEKDPSLEAAGLVYHPERSGDSRYEVVPLYDGTHATENFFQKRRYINILDPKATATFLEVTHEAYARHLGDLSKLFEAVFTDEPSLITAYIPKGKTYPLTLPWSDSLPQSFFERKGYDLTPHLESLYKDAGEDYRRIRCDFYEVISELCAESYFGQIQTWCKNHGIASSGHLLGEETLVWQTYFEGNPFACYRKFDVPGIDMILSSPERIMRENYFIVPKLASSAARLAGKQEVMCEISDFFESMDKHPATLEQMMGTASIMYALGVTELVSMYSTAVLEVLKRNDPSASQIPIVGADQYRRYTSFASRLKLIFSQGKIENRVALLHPIISLWANFTPSDRSMYEPHPNERVRFIDEEFTNLCRALLQSQIDFDIVDDRAIAEAVIVGDELRVSGNVYSFVVLPPMDTIRVQTIQKMARYAHEGGFVLAHGLLPTHAAEGREDDEEIMRYVREIFKNPKNTFVEGQTADLIGRLKLQLHPNCELNPPTSEILCTRLSKNNTRIFFLANTSSQAWQGQCRFDEVGRVTLSYPDSANVVTPDSVEAEDSATNLTISLECYQSVFVSFLNSKR